MTLRPVDVSDRDPVSRARVGQRPALTWLAIGDLLIDDDYQRPLGPKNWSAIQRIARAFDWAMFTPIIAAPLGAAMRIETKTGQRPERRHRGHEA